MYRSQRVILLVFLPALALSVSCASRQHRAADIPDASRPPGVRGEPNVLRLEQLRQATGSDALQLIEQLRPAFLRIRGPLHTAAVFVDHIHLGGLQELRGIPASSIAEIRYLDGRQATQLFGSGYTGGVIHVLTRSSS